MLRTGRLLLSEVCMLSGVVQSFVMWKDEILHDCAYVQHEIDRVRGEKCLCSQSYGGRTATTRACPGLTPKFSGRSGVQQGGI